MVLIAARVSTPFYSVKVETPLIILSKYVGIAQQAFTEVMKQIMSWVLLV